MSFKTIEWVGGLDGYVRLLDQTRLPTEVVSIECHDVETLWEAIRVLRVRGAPAIGVAAAMGVVLGMQTAVAPDADAYWGALKRVTDYLRTARPTAVNLFWALDRMERVAQAHRALPAEQITEKLLREARAIQAEDVAMCEAIGRHGADLVQPRQTILTHCNAGALATAGCGTALAVMYAAHQQGKRIRVFADETRPLLQGARLTTWELQHAGIDVTLICDNMAAQVMKEGKIDLVITGADRIAANGDAANKIGTYGVAVLAQAHHVPFYIAAPSSTFDLSLATGDEIPIEQRDPTEIVHPFGRQTAPDDVGVYNPAFDVTPARLIHGIITERGLIQPVNRDTVTAHLAQG